VTHFNFTLDGAAPLTKRLGANERGILGFSFVPFGKQIVLLIRERSACFNKMFAVSQE
jgi:hypothetical protein